MEGSVGKVHRAPIVSAVVQVFGGGFLAHKRFFRRRRCGLRGGGVRRRPAAGNDEGGIEEGIGRGNGGGGYLRSQRVYLRVPQRLLVEELSFGLVEFCGADFGGGRGWGIAVVIGGGEA